MTVDWQFLPVKMQGMDTKTDDKNLPTGKFTLLQNVVMRKTGKLEKRFGYNTVSVPLTTGQAIFDYDGSRYTMFLDRIALNINTYVTRYASHLAFSASKQVLSTDESDDVLVGISHGQSTSAAIWKKVGNNALYYQLIDTSSMTPIGSARAFTSASTTSDFCCINYAADEPLVVISDTTGLELWKISSSGASRVFIITGTAAGIGTRAHVNGSSLYISWVSSTANLNVTLVNLLTYTTTRTTTLLSGTSLNFSDVNTNQNGKVLVAGWNNNTGNCEAVGFRLSADLTSSEASANSGSRGPIANASDVAITGRGTSNEWVGFYYVAAVNLTVATNYTLRMTDLGAAGLDLWFGIKPASRAWSITRDDAVWHPHCYFQAMYTESSVFLISYVSGFQAMPVNATLFGRVPSINYKSQISPGDLRFAVPEIIYGYVQSGTTSGIIGVRYFSLTTSLTPTFAYPPRGCCHNADGTLKFFDGSYEYTPTPVHVPRAPALANAGAGSVAAGTYLYCTVFEWTDSIGNVIRSSPSLPTQIVLAGASQVTVTGYGTLPSSYLHYAANGTAQGAKLVIYRTAPGGSIFYRLGTVSIDSTASNYNFTDNVATVETSTPLYTTGGALENINPPPFRAICSGVSRIFGLSWEADELWYSKKFVPGEIPSFNEALRAQLDRVGGAPVAVIEMDDKVVVFKQRAIQVFYGDGPDETGAGGFQGPQTVNTEIGAKSARACVLTDEGIIFQSNQGYWLLNRGLQCVHIGAEVEDYNNLNIVGCFNLSDRNYTYFYSSDGTTLVYDSYHRIWSIFTNQNAKAVALINGTPAYLNTNSTFVYTEGTVAGTEGGTNYDMRITTGWISLAGIQGFQRVRRLAFLGTSFATHTAQVNISYDFLNSVEDTYSVSSATIISTGKYQYQLRLNRQKCEAIKIDLLMTSNNQGFDLSGIAIEAGIKPKTARMSPTARVTGV